MNDRGLNDDGTIAREGALDRVPATFAAVVDAVRARLTETFGPRLHSAYLYGSIPRGTAATARTPSADPVVLALLIDDLGPWLAAEYTAVHGEKAPRP